MEKEGDLTECRLAVGARRAGLSISETVALLGFSHTTILEFTKNGLKKENIQGVSVLWPKMPC